MNYDRYMFFLHGPETYIRKFALQIVWHNCWIMEGKHQKHNVVWTAPFWIIVDTFTASHVRKNVNRFPTYLLEWLVTCGKCWPSPFCCLIFLSNHKQKTHHQKPTSKTKCCLNSTLLNHSGHFYSIPRKKFEQIPPPIFFKWLVTFGTCWSSPFCFLFCFQKPYRKLITKNHYQNTMLFEQHPLES